MAQPRISYDGDQNAAGNDGSKLDRRDASAGQEYFPLGGGSSTPTVRKSNQVTEAPGGNPSFPVSVPDEARRAKEQRGGMGAEGNDKE